MYNRQLSDLTITTGYYSNMGNYDADMHNNMDTLDMVMVEYTQDNLVYNRDRDNSSMMDVRCSECQSPN